MRRRENPRMPAFHLAFPVHNIEAARRFYVDELGCSVGREAERWIDFDLRGHQLSAHLVDGLQRIQMPTNEVDGDGIPVRHFGLILPWEEWQETSRVWTERCVRFLVAPRIRFAGQVGEQATLFVEDPSGNAIELKSFKDPTRVFAR